MPIPGIEKNIGAFLDKVTNKYGKKKAITFDSEGFSISYHKLNQRVNQFANALNFEGIKRGDHVGVMLNNCPEFPITWLALAKLGSVMVPINTRYKISDLEYVLNDSDSRALIIDTEFISIFKKIRPKCPKTTKIFRVGEGEEEIGS